MVVGDVRRVVGSGDGVRHVTQPPARWAGGATRIAISLLILGYLGSKVDWAKIGQRLLDADPIWLALACLLFGLAFFLASLRWWLLLRVQMIRLSLRVVTALTLIGQFFNSFLLGSTGGDVVRAFYAVTYNPLQRTHAMLSIIVDRAMGLFVVLSFALVGLWWQLGLVMQSNDIRLIGIGLLWLFAIGVIAVAGLLVTPFSRLPAIAHRIWRRIPRRRNFELLVQGTRQHAKSPGRTCGAILCSVGIQFLVFSAGYCIARAMGLNVTFGQMVIVLAVVTCVVSLPISIGGHGVREGAFVLLFAAFGVIPNSALGGEGQEPAILFSLLYFVLLAAWSLVGGLIYLTFRHASGEPS